VKKKRFCLLKYEELIPIVEKIELKRESFFEFFNNYNNLINSSKTIMLDEDSLTGFEKGNIFVDSKDFSEELAWEILRPVTVRQMRCFRDGMFQIFIYYKGSYVNSEHSFEVNLLNELVDCFLDYTRCYKKIYVSYSEYVLFEEFIDIVFSIFKKKVD